MTNLIYRFVVVILIVLCLIFISLLGDVFIFGLMGLSVLVMLVRELFA